MKSHLIPVCQVEPVETRIALLQLGDDTQRLGIVIEAAKARHAPIEGGFTGMAERRVAEIMRKRERLGEIFVKTEHTGDRAGHLRDFQ